jgi:hypothetical protein
MQVVLNAGGTDNTAIADIDKITFGSGSMLLAGTAKSFAVSDVRKIVFGSGMVPAQTREVPALSRNVTHVRRLADGRLSLSLTLRRRGDVSIAVIDLAGRKLHRMCAGRPEGAQSIVWDPADGLALADGSYVLRVETDGSQFSHRFTVVR